MTDAADTTAKKVRGKPFQKGQPSANPAGRPKGSRNKISQDYISELAADFEKYGLEVIVKLREEDPRAYIKCVADLVPKEFDIKHDAGDAFLSLWQAMQGGKPSRD
jgi:uncharacterized protein DUF5681